MINSRNLDDLEPSTRALAHKFIKACHDVGIDLLVTSTYRDYESQNKLYAQGRTAPGPRVTNARGGYSYHNFRVAFDVVPLMNGKPVWGTSGESGVLWKQVGAIGVSLGLEWAGNWKTFKEYPHFQYTGGKTLEYYRNNPDVWQRN